MRPVLLFFFAFIANVQCFYAECSYAERPNVLFIISDDQRYDSMGQWMPRVQERIFNRGVSFSKAYVTTPACCPSRVSMLTGKYARNHGVKLNNIPFLGETIVPRFKSAGYKTGIIGKYLNSWRGKPIPDFTFWSVFPRGSNDYYNVRMNVNGEWKWRRGYITDALADDAIKFISESHESKDPFFLVFAPNAPHPPAKPALKDRGVYKKITFTHPASINESAKSGVPEWLQKIGAFSRSETWFQKLEDLRRRELETLRSLDRNIARILDTLDEKNIVNNTIVVFISDNGVMWGEHGLKFKDCVYEPAIHVPFAIRYPAHVDGGRIRSELVANIDIAPTLLELTGVTSIFSMDGQSLAPLLRGEFPTWREDLLIENYKDSATREPFSAVHTGRYVYVDNLKSIDELYDLELDPDQLANLAIDEAYTPLIQEMKDRLRRLTEK